MSSTSLFIKNMVCQRCVMAVEQVVEQLQLPVSFVHLGEVGVHQTLSDEQKQAFSSGLQALGFELIDNRRHRLIEHTKHCLRELVFQNNAALPVPLSAYLSEKLHQEYSSISSLFSEVEGATIEHFFIALKIERVKELLLYDEYTLSEIAHLLHYSSVAHLSNQFKKVTGLSPSHFKQLRTEKRKAIDKL